MKYKVIVTSYYPERKVSGEPVFEHLRAVEDILNLKNISKETKADLAGYSLKEMHTTSTGERIVYTIILQKE